MDLIVPWMVCVHHSTLDTFTMHMQQCCAEGGCSGWKGSTVHICCHGRVAAKEKA